MSLYDSVNADAEPDGPNDYGAGYGDGRYDNWAQVEARFGPHAVLEVCVNPADQIGNCLDIENGDARPADAPRWTAQARQRGVKVVWNYCNAYTWPAVLDQYAAQRLPLPDRWWIAEYTNVPHLPTCRGITADACQYAGGMTAAYDTSCFKPGVFTPPTPTPTPKPAPPKPAPLPHKEDDMALANDGHAQYIVTVDSTGKLRKSPMPAGTNVEAIAASGTPNWGLQAQMLKVIADAG